MRELHCVTYFNITQREKEHRKVSIRKEQLWLFAVMRSESNSSQFRLFQALMKKILEVRPDFDGALAYIDLYGRQV